MPGPAYALQARGDLLRALDLADQVEVPDVDAKLERRGGDYRPELAALELILHLQAELPRHAPVVSADLHLRPPRLGEHVQLRRHPLGPVLRVTEDECGPVLLDEVEELLVDLLQHLLGFGLREVRDGRYDLHVDVPARAQVHN